MRARSRTWLTTWSSKDRLSLSAICQRCLVKMALTRLVMGCRVQSMTMVREELDKSVEELASTIHSVWRYCSCAFCLPSGLTVVAVCCVHAERNLSRRDELRALDQVTFSSVSSRPS